MELTCLSGIDISGMSGRHSQWLTGYLYASLLAHSLLTPWPWRNMFHAMKQIISRHETIAR
jgi:hypothetical protein